MKKLIVLLLTLVASQSYAAQQTITGGSGVTWLQEYTKLNANFTEVYTDIGNLVIGTDVQAYDADLTTYAGITPSANIQSTLGAATYAAARALWDLEAGTDFYSISAADAAFEAELDNSAGLLAALDDETGTGVAVFSTSPTLVTPALGTPSALVLTNATGLPGTSLTADSVVESSLDCTAGPTDNYLLSYDSGSGGFTWVAPGAGSGDLLADGTVPMTAHWSFGAYNITGGVNSTWSGLGTFGTLSAGAAGFTVDADGDVTAKSITVDPSALPTLTFEDSDLLGADKEAAKIFANGTTLTDGAEVTDLTVTYMDAGTVTNALVIDGSDNQVEFAIDTTLQAGDIVLAEMATDSVDYTKTVGSFKSLTPVTDDCDNFAANFTGANLYGGTFICNAAGTCQLPVMVAGMNFSVITLGAVACVIDTNAADGYLMDGVTGVEGANLTNLSTAGDIAVLQYYTADDWLITTNGWTAE